MLPPGLGISSPWGSALNRQNTAFKGFPPEAVTFLVGLSRNNNKTWFEAHRGDYEAAIVQPALAFVESMATELRRDVPSVMAEPRVGGSFFRIHRDTRFSADKRPYKTHVGIRLRDGDTITSSKCTGPLFYVEFDARILRLGVGVKEFDKSTLATYRDAVARKNGTREIGDLIRHAEATGHAIAGELLARTPPGYTDQPDNELLKRKGLFIHQEVPLPDDFHGSGFVAYCRRRFGPYLPLFTLLRKIAVRNLAT